MYIAAGEVEADDSGFGSQPQHISMYVAPELVLIDQVLPSLPARQSRPTPQNADYFALRLGFKSTRFQRGDQR